MEEYQIDTTVKHPRKHPDCPQIAEPDTAAKKAPADQATILGKRVAAELTDQDEFIKEATLLLDARNNLKRARKEFDDANNVMLALQNTFCDIFEVTEVRCVEHVEKK